jgi:NADH-quinone oxidoreductase subunit N
MPMLHWGFLGASSLAMIVGIVNLFGVESIAAQAAATLFQ